MSDTTTNLGLPYLAAAQAQKHVTLNEALARLDALVQGNVISRTATAEPGPPADSALYILPSGKTGAYWGAMANYALAFYRDGVWEQITPREGWTFYVRDEDVHVVFTGAVWTRLTQQDSQAGFRNRLINGRFSFWQRGASFTATGYCADRWKLELSGATATASRQAHTPGQTDVPGEPRYFMRLAATGGAGASDYVRMVQPVEDVRSLAGQSATLSFYARRSAGSGNLSTELVQAFGSGGSPSADVTQIGVQKHTLTTTWQRFVVPLTAPPISGKTLGANEDDSLRVLFWASAGSSFNARTGSLGQQSVTIDIADVQLEPGSAATPFEMRPVSTELALCQRYFYRWGQENADSGTGFRMFGYGKASVFEGQAIRHPVAMRAVPTVAKVGSWSVTNCGQPSLSDPSTQSCNIRASDRRRLVRCLPQRFRRLSPGRRGIVSLCRAQDLFAPHPDLTGEASRGQ